MTDLENLLLPPWSRAALVHDETNLFGQPTMDALSARIVSVGLDPTIPQVGAQTTPSPRMQGQPVRSVQTGHTWTDEYSEGGSTNLADTGRKFVGNQSITRVSNGIGGDSRLKNIGGAPRNFVDHLIRVVMRVESIDKAGTYRVFAGANNLADHFVWSVSGSALSELFVEGKWREVTLNFADANKVGTPNRAALTDFQVSLVDNGSGSVTFSIARVDAVPEPIEEWPLGVCSFSFDDSFATQDFAVRTMARNDFRGTLYTLAESVGKSWGLTLEQLRSYQDDYGWEIGSHAATEYNHNRYLPALTAQELDVELRTLKEWMVRNGFHAVNHFCYPGGRFNAAVIEAVRRYFPASARSTFGTHLESVPASSKHQLRARTLGPGMTLTAAKARVDAAVAGRGWIHFYGHKFTESGGGGGEWKMDDFYQLVEYVRSKGIPVRPVGEVLTRTYEATSNHIVRGNLDVTGRIAPVEGIELVGDAFRVTAYNEGAFDFNALHVSRSSGDVTVGRGDVVHTGGKGPVVWYGATKYRLAVNSSGEVVAIPV